MWENLNYSKTQKFLRRCFSNLVTIILLLTTLLLLVYFNA